MDYPADGTPFELDDQTVDLLYKAAAGDPMTNEQRRDAVTAVDYISAATLLIEPEDDEDDEDAEAERRQDDPDRGYYDPTTDDGATFYGEGLTRPSYGD
jgi:hypothetical protein